ncbi:MAG: sigma 54-interacting transcriptional regulator [Deltaproteobacteria bacterium]|nr:sigma 54-interacting transcriptional regulator [Deltaproteobacteria bacterium]
MSSAKFPDYAAPTKIAYVDNRPSELHLRRCKFVLEAGGRQQERTFEQGVITIGAMEDNDLVVNDETVSRYHAKVQQTTDGYLLVDENSTNGTFINRVRIKEAFLKPGCTIQIGQVEAKFDFADERVQITPSDKDRLGLLIGRNIKMREIYRIIEKIAPTATTVVIEGETGTGKEVVAQTIHQLSDRKEGPMMIFDCGAVPENLVESELFGHEKGSFTGAIMTRQGLFEMGHGGTVFLDELGELALDLQPKLLRALEQREIRRVGGARPLKVDVRVIAATNRDLDEEVRAGRFREDLYYRLSVVRLYLPPLRERPEDIPLLAQHILEKHASNRDEKGKRRVIEIERDATEALCAYKWPGNVRELVNTIERALTFCDGQSIRLQDLPETARSTESTSSNGSATFKDAKERWVASFERDYIISLLRRNGGNISHAAREADIDRKYFRKLMRKYGIEAGADAGDD